MRMRTTVNIDQASLEAVASLLQTDSLSETVNAALREVIAATRRQQLAGRIRGGKLPVPTPAERSRLRQQQVATGTLAKR